MKPLDLEKLEEEIIEEMNKKQPHDLQGEVDIVKEKVKQRIKSALQGLLKDINNVFKEDLFSKNWNINTTLELEYRQKKELIDLVRKWFGEVDKND